MAIEQAEFIRVWRHICKRFGRDHDHEQAVAYWEYLNDFLTTKEFIGAARSIWATSKWFPRPADFLIADTTEVWRAVQHAASVFTVPCPPEYAEAFKAIPKRGQQAVQDMGGIDAVKREMGFSYSKAREAFDKAYVEVCASDTMALSAGVFRELPKAS